MSSSDKCFEKFSSTFLFVRALERKRRSIGIACHFVLKWLNTLFIYIVITLRRKNDISIINPSLFFFCTFDGDRKFVFGPAM